MKLYPVNMNIELTTRCPLNCPQCYCELHTGKDLDLKQALYWLDEARRNNVQSIYLSGGETLCYPYLDEVLNRACEICQDVNLAISGYGFTQDVLDKFCKYGVNGVSVSLNGSTEKINMMSRDGFQYAIDALELLSKNRYHNSIINWVMHSNNCDDFENVVQLAEQYNVNKIIIFGFKPDRHHALKTQPTYQQMMDMANYVKGYTGKVKIYIESCYSPLLAMVSETEVFGNINIKTNKGCLAGISRFSISVEGKLSPCRHLEIFEDYLSLRDYWEKSEVLKKIREFHKGKNAPCNQCKYSMYCRPCLAIENKVNGKLYPGNRICSIGKQNMTILAGEL